MCGAICHTWWPGKPAPMAISFSGPMALPLATAVRAVCDKPPSNWTISASTQCLANRPSPRATKGTVWITLGGATDTPMVILRGWPVQPAAAWAGAAPAVNTLGEAAALAPGLALADAAGLAAAL